MRNLKADCCRRREWNNFMRSKTDAQIRKDSYHGDCPLKPISTIKKELKELFLSVKGNSTAKGTYDSYIMCGLDRSGFSCDEYLFGIEFYALQNKHKPDYAMMLNHKVYTLVYLQARGVRVSRILGQVSADRCFRNLSGSECEDFYTWFDKQQTPIFCKLPDGYQGTSCFVLEKKGDRYLKSDKPISREELDALLPNLQIEEVIQQHPDMSAIYPNAVNTCRIVTVCKDGKPQFFSGYSLFGCGGTRVSNGFSGGIFVGFDENGHLNEKGMRELSLGGGMYDRHPDTGVVFKDCTIPCFKEVIELACAAHRTMDTIRSIGWDIAITPTGPLIIEGNQGWSTMEHQIFNGGMRKKAYEMLG